MINNKSYIIKTSSGECYKFFYDNNKIINQRIDTKTEPSSDIINDVYENFYVYIDNNDIIHLICKNRKSEILYLKYENNIWQKKIIAKTNDYSEFDNYCRLQCLPTSIIIYYVLKNKDKYILVYQTISNDKLSHSKVIDNLVYASIPYSVHKDSNNNTYVFYNPFQDEYKRIGFKVFDYEEKKWSIFHEISQSKYNTNIPYILIDRYNNINLIWTRHKGSISNIIFQKIIPYKLKDYNKNIEISLYSSNKEVANCMLFMLDNDLFAIWESEDKIYSCLSIDNNYYWNKPSYQQISLDKKYELFSYSTNYREDLERLDLHNIFGYIDNTLNLFLISEYFKVRNNYNDAFIINEEDDILDQFGVYFHNFKNMLYKIISQINNIKNEKNDIYNKSLDLSKSNYGLTRQVADLNNQLNNDKFEKEKLKNEINSLKKQVENLNSIINLKNEYILKCEKDNNLLNNKYLNYKEKKMWITNKLINYFKKIN